MSWRDKLKWGDESLKTPEHDALVLWLRDNLSSVIDSLKISPEYKMDTPIIEYPITNKHSSILCFIDLKVLIEYMEKVRENFSYKNQLGLLFEVKPKIESFGEILRQLHSYKIYYEANCGNNFGTGKCKVIVVSPDKRFREDIESQGFGFINPDDFVVKE